MDENLTNEDESKEVIQGEIVSKEEVTIEEKSGDELLELYIGENAKDIMESNLNIPAGVSSFFIGPVWFFYRKSYLIGIILLIIFLVLYVYSPALNILMSIGYLFFANKVYIWDAKRIIEDIVKNNKGISEDELHELVKEKGGVNKTAAIIYTLIALILLVIGMIIGAWIFMMFASALR